MLLNEVRAEDWSIVAHHDDDESDYMYHKIPSKELADKIAVGLAKDNFDEFYKNAGDQYTVKGDTIYSNGNEVTSFDVVATKDVDRMSRMGSPITVPKAFLKQLGLQ